VLEYPKDIGNFFGFEINGKLVIDIAPRLSYHAQEISNLLCEEQHPVIVEIGPGLGGIPYNLFKYFNSRCTYIIFEIPEVSVITKYFLKSVFPDKKFLFYGGSKIQDINLKEYDIIFMPHYELKNFPEKYCDLVFNSSSLTEMSHSTVKEYLVQINRICKKYFMHINEESAFMYKTSTGEIRATVDLNETQFELPDFRRIYRFPALLGIPGSSYGDYFYYEYLYERKKQ
jgi:phospholipid N-methyltransferase